MFLFFTFLHVLPWVLNRSCLPLLFYNKFAASLITNAFSVRVSLIKPEFPAQHSALPDLPV